MPVAKELEEKERLTLQNFFTGKCVEWKLFEVMLQLCLMKSDIIQNDPPSTGPIPSEGSEDNLQDESILPACSRSTALPMVHIWHDNVASTAGVNSLSPSLSQSFASWSGGFICMIWRISASALNRQAVTLA